MKARQSSVSITYDGKAHQSSILTKRRSLTLTQPAAKQTASTSRSLSAALPPSAWQDGGKQTAFRHHRPHDWAAQGDNRTLDCGDFLVDRVSYSGWPWTGTVKAVSVPANTGFRQTKRTKVWEKATVQKIGQEIASNAGIELFWDVEGDDPQITTLEQSETTDCEFYMNLCKTYGLSMKVYSKKS